MFSWYLNLILNLCFYCYGTDRNRLNHRTAPIALQECLAFQEDKLAEALNEANALPSLRENMILSTCNRVEIYAAARETEKALFDLKGFLSQYHHLSLKEFEKSLYSYTGEEAVKHIFRVASSLDSMVVGEPQILGQIKDAYDIATQTKTSALDSSSTSSPRL